MDEKTVSGKRLQVMAGPKTPDDREERLKQALRDNLRRRKSASRKRDEESPDKPNRKSD